MAPLYREETATPPPMVQSLPARPLRGGRPHGVERRRQKPSGDNEALRDFKVRAQKELDKAHKTADAREFALLNEIALMKATAASIKDEKVKNLMEEQLDGIARGSRAATEEVQKLREASVDPAGDTIMDGLDDIADVEDADEPPVQSKTAEAIEKQLDEELKHLPLPVNQKFYEDESKNLRPVDSIAAADIHPMAKQTIEIDDHGTLEVTKYLVRYGEGSGSIWRFLRANEISFDASIVANLQTFPTPKFNLRRPKQHPDGVVKSDLQYLSNVAFHGSPEILCDEGLEAKQIKNGKRHPDTYCVLAMPNGKYKFPTRTVYNHLHGKGAAPGFKDLVDPDQEPYHGASVEIVNIGRARQRAYYKDKLRKELLRKAEVDDDGQEKFGERSPESGEAGQNTNQNASTESASSFPAPPSNGSNTTSAGQGESSTQGIKRRREETPAPENSPADQSTPQEGAGSTTGSRVGNTEATKPNPSGVSDTRINDGSKTPRPPAKVVKTSAGSSTAPGENPQNPNIALPSIESSAGSSTAPGENLQDPNIALPSIERDLSPEGDGV